MIDHISTYATDYSATKQFYQAAFAPLGYILQTEFVAEWNEHFPTQRMCTLGKRGSRIESKDVHTPRHVAFSAGVRSGVDKFYSEGLEHGGKDNGKSGLRPMYHEHYYGAFLIDPDGNNVEAVCHTPE